MKLLSYLLFFIFLMQAANGIRINEIMYNPNSEQGGDSYSEWVELYNNGSGSINIGGWKICNNNLLGGYVNYSDNSDENIYLNNNMIIPNNSYVIITDGSSGTKAYGYFNISNTSIALHTGASSICSGLSNSGKTVSLYNSNNILVDQVNYTNIADEGFSIRFDNGSWKPSSILGGTPGYKNSVGDETSPPAEETKNIILKTYLDETIYVNIKYTKLFKIKIENKDNCSAKDTVSVSYNITNPLLIKQDKFTKEIGCSSYASTGEFTPTMAGDYTLCGTIINSTITETDFSDNSACSDFQVIDTSTIPCDIKVNITTNETLIYEAGQSIKFYNNLNNETFPFVIEYWIEDFFGNIYKNKYNTTNTNQKSWKTNIAEQDRVLFIKSKVYPNCNDANSSDNYAEKMFIVKSGSTDSTKNIDESNLEIIEVDDKVKFGDTVGVKVNIYKGKTSKYSISLWVEDNGKKISETTKIHLYDKYSSYHGQLPIKLDPNCNLKLKNGKYDVVIKGLDKEDEEEIKIEGIKTSACSTSSSTSSTSSKKSSTKKFSFELKDFNKNVEVGRGFTTKIVLDNNNDQDINIKLWSYVYRGSKSYSGDREENKKEFILKAHSLHIIELDNIVENAEQGNYKLKVLVNKNNQKTNSQITEDVIINKNNINSNKKEISSNERNVENRITNNALLDNYGLVYESTAEKAKNLVPVFIIILSVLLNIVLIWRR